MNFFEFEPVFSIIATAITFVLSWLSFYTIRESNELIQRSKALLEEMNTVFAPDHLNNEIYYGTEDNVCEHPDDVDFYENQSATSECRIFFGSYHEEGCSFYAEIEYQNVDDAIKHLNHQKDREGRCGIMEYANGVPSWVRKPIGFFAMNDEDDGSKVFLSTHRLAQ